MYKVVLLKDKSGDNMYDAIEPCVDSFAFCTAVTISWWSLSAGEKGNYFPSPRVGEFNKEG